jgi:hypothetical protein
MEQLSPRTQARTIAGIIAAGLLVMSFALVAALINRQQLLNAGATVPLCPNANALGGLPTSNRVGASFSGDPTATYVFESFFNEGGSGGIPGLVAYCVYTSTDPDSGAATPATFTFATDPGSGDFGFVRSGGDPTNIPLDGASHTMGTATWSGGVPGGQIIALHINFAAECTALYGMPKESCFVKPGSKSTEPTPTNTPAGVPTPTNTPPPGSTPTPTNTPPPGSTPTPTIIPTPTGTPHPK